MTSLDKPVPAGRLILLDLARTASLLAMIVFHFTYDLELFGYVPSGTMMSWGWQVYARLVAGSFLFLAGFSLYLAHGNGIRWQKALRRLALLAAAATLVTTATYIGMPDSFVYFGILHSITVASVIGLGFLRLPAFVTVIVGAGVLVAASGLQSEIFNAPWLLWLGLGTQGLRSVDYEPVFPWLAPLLFGIAVAKTGTRWGVFARRQGRHDTPTKTQRWLTFPGQHSLAIYLIHQPILIGLIWSATQVIR